MFDKGVPQIKKQYISFPVTICKFVGIKMLFIAVVVRIIHDMLQIKCVTKTN